MTNSIINVSVLSGKQWKDTEGVAIQAHGGGMLYHGGVDFRGLLEYKWELC